MAKGHFFLYFVAAGALSFTVIFLIFILARPECYPKKVIRMSSTDMRLAIPVSSFWCEALELSSDHPFLAFRMSKEPKISPFTLSRNEIDLKLKLKLSETHQVQYFLLPGTLVTAITCATDPGATIYLLRGRDLQNHQEQSTAFSYDENGKDSDKSDADLEELGDTSNEQLSSTAWLKALKFQDIPAGNSGNEDCEFSPSSKLFQVNITVPDTFHVLIHHKGPVWQNLVKVRLFLDRTSYNVQSDVKSVHVCSGGLFTSSCTVHLDFLSTDRVLIRMPGEPGAGLTTFRVRTSCKPRFPLISATYLIIPFGILSFSILFEAYTRRNVIQRYFKKHHCDRISMMTSPLLNSHEDEILDVEQNVISQRSNNNDCLFKEVCCSTKYSNTQSSHGEETVQKSPEDPPPSSQSMKFNSEDTAAK